jgi:hypothetical protein
MDTEEKPPKGHYDLYKVCNAMEAIIRQQHAEHPRTKCWKHLVS